MSSPHWKNRCTSEDTPLSGKVNSGKLRKLKKLGKLGKLNSYATAQYQKHSKNRLVVTSVFQFSSFPDSALAQLPEAVGQPPRLRGTASRTQICVLSRTAPSERVEIGRALEGELQGRAGNPTGANQHGGGIQENFPELPKGQTRDLAAKAAGFGNGNCSQIHSLRSI